MNKIEDDVWSMRVSKRALQRKRQRQVTVVLAVLVVLGLMAWLAAIGSRWLAVLFAALFISSALLLVYYVSRAVVRGELQGRFGAITFRDKSPIAFWVGIGVHGVFAGFLFFSGLAPHWFLALLRSMHSQH
jgi:hypothetical protein